MMKHLKKIRSAILAWLVAATGCEEASRPPAWNECRLSSCWDGNGARRMMNLASPHFSEAKAREYLDWQYGRGCDHIHILLINQHDGEGAGYDALGNSDHKAIAIKRVQHARDRGFGVVAWVVADDSGSFRRAVFADPGKYARSLRDFFPYISYIVLGLEMNEGVGTLADWTALRDAILAAGWRGQIATHHTGGKYIYSSLGSIVMDQLSHHCTSSEVYASVTKLRRRGYAVCGFEYARSADREKAQAALDAGAFAVGNW